MPAAGLLLKTGWADFVQEDARSRFAPTGADSSPSA